MFPYPYRKPQLDIFYQLVRDANPGIQLDLPSNTTIGVPVSQSVPSTGFPANTNVVINGKGQYAANKRVTYRRIEMAKMFLGQTFTITPYSAASTLPIADVVEALNATYGFSFVTSDFSVSQINLGANNLTFASGSLNYTGSFSLTWTKGKRQISSVVANKSNLAGRLYPGGNTFDGTRKKQGQYFSYDQSFSLLSATFSGLTTGTLDYTVAAHKQIIDYLTANISSRINGTDHTNDGGLQGLTFAKYALPSANVPEANSLKYSNVFAIFAQSTSWFQGTILLHY
jgi:hypothetical protein